MVRSFALAPRQAEAILAEREHGIGRHHIHVVGLNTQAIMDLLNRHGGLFGEDLRQQAFMIGIEVLNDHVRHGAFRRQRHQKLRDGFESACRSADGDNG